MSKKSRRQRKLNLPPEAYNAPTSAPVPHPAAGKTAPTTTPIQRAATIVNWQKEYSDVLGDLKRTGILAVVIMAAMIGLSFIIR
ncbi:MAG TPA: hypothetical protein VGK81_09030 [Anaerolineae bacterium]